MAEPSDDGKLQSALAALDAQSQRAATAKRDASVAKKAKHMATSEATKQSALRVVAESRLCHGLADAAAEIRDAQAKQEEAEAAERATADAREAERSRTELALCKKREEIKTLKQRLIDEQAALMRMESEASLLAISTTDSRDAEAAARQAAEEEATAQRAIADQAVSACAQFDDKTLSSILRYMAPDDGPARERADAILRIRSLDALSSSDAAVTDGTRSLVNYKRSVVVGCEGLIELASKGDRDRIVILEDAVHEWLERQQRRRPMPPEVRSRQNKHEDATSNLVSLEELDSFVFVCVSRYHASHLSSPSSSKLRRCGATPKKCATISVRCKHWACCFFQWGHAQ